MKKIEVKEIINDVKQSLTNKVLVYPSGKGYCKVVSVGGEEGPIYFKRRKEGSSANWEQLGVETISRVMIWRYVNALNAGIPVNVERVLGASYNTRSVLETIVAHCPNFFLCRPRRITEIGSTKITTENGHKCVIFNKDKVHDVGRIEWDKTVDGFISEVPGNDTYWDAKNVQSDTSTAHIPAKPKLDPNISRIHSQMQVNLTKVADWFNVRSWVAVQDHGIVSNGINIMQFPSVVKDLHDERVISNYPNAIKVASNIDCIWFNGGMPFVFEVEHTTGVTTGLTRMNSLMTELCHLKTNYVIVAPDSDRQMVIKKASDHQFSKLDLWYMSYTNLTELTDMTIRHPSAKDSDLVGISKSFMEKLN